MVIFVLILIYFQTITIYYQIFHEDADKMKQNTALEFVLSYNVYFAVQSCGSCHQGHPWICKRTHDKRQDTHGCICNRWEQCRSDARRYCQETERCKGDAYRERSGNYKYYTELV